MITFVMSILVAIVGLFFLKMEVRSLMLEIKKLIFCSVGTKWVLIL